jgi:tetratricopeptide (TPR) repeat protein
MAERTTVKKVLGDDLMAWADFMSQIETLIVQGQHEQCRELLLVQNPRRIPRTLVAGFAEIAWRINSYLFAMKCLQHIIYPENSFLEPASAREKIVYATSLSSLGATTEAISILEQIDGETEPSALFHLASAHMCAWDYEAAIPHLKEYIKSNKISPYRQLVGKVNWAAALVHLESWEKAVALLEEIQHECEANSYNLLLGNCFELRAQVEIYQRNLIEARKFLAESIHQLKDQTGHYAMYAEKWHAVCDCLQAETQEQKNLALESLNQVRLKAGELKHWNTLRECDLFEAITRQDEALLKKVIMGTPSELYRQRARKLFGTKMVSMGQFHFYIGDPLAASRCETSFDPTHRMSSGAALSQKPLLFALFDALTQDFYQPQSIAMIFQKIYPDEKLDPFNSPSRVLQLLRRLNAWFEDNKQPLRIDFVKSEFQLTSIEPVNLLIERGTTRTVGRAKLSELKSQFGHQPFSVQDVCTVLQVSKATAERVIAKAFREGQIIKERKSRGVSYRIKSKGHKSKAA